MIGFKSRGISVKRIRLGPLLLVCSVLTAAMLPVSAQAQGICGRTPQVQTAILSKIPSSVSDCAFVTTAQLDAITGTLNLRGMGLTSLMPDDFDGMRHLEALWLQNNSITSLPADVFDGLESLSTLWLQNGSIASLSPDSFDGLTRLEFLRLDYNRIPSLPGDVFDDLTSLTYLNLEDNSIPSLPEDVFDSLTNLTELYLAGNSITALPENVFEGLTKLKTLGLNRNSIVSVPITSLPEGVFDGLTSLTGLSLAKNRITSLPEDIFAGLTKLDALWLTDNRITNQGLPDDVFEGLTSLDTLVLINIGIDALPANIFEGLASLTNLSLTGNSITNQGLPDDVFDGLTSLTTLYLENNNIAAFPTNALSALSALGTDGGFLRIEDNPNIGSPSFIIPYELVRTSAGTGSPATIRVRLPLYVPESLSNQMVRVSLSATGGMLAVGSDTPAASVTVALDTDVTVTATGGSSVFVFAAAPTTQTPTDGMQIGSAVALMAITGSAGTPAEGQPTVTGTLRVGEVLTASVDGITDADGLPDPFTPTYQWHRSTDEGFTNPINIDRATNATYTLAGPDAGHYIRVAVGFTDSAGNAEMVFSMPTERIADLPKIEGGRMSGQRLSAIGAVADLSTATVFTASVASHLGAPSTGLRIDGQSAGSRLRSILQAVVPAGNQCLQAELDPHERLQYGISGSSLTASPCGSMDSDEMMRRLRSAAEVGDVSLGLGGKESGLDIWLHATSFEVSGSPLINSSQLNYDGRGLLAYVGVVLDANDRIKYGFTFGLSDTSLDLALVSGGERNDSVSRNLMFGSGFIDYRLGTSTDYRLRAVLGLGAGDADFTVVNDVNNQTFSGSADADLTFFTLNFSREFKLNEKWLLTPAVQLANSSGSTDAVTLTGANGNVEMGSSSSNAIEFAVEVDASVSLSNGGQFTIGSAFRNGSGDLEYSGAVDLIARYQSQRFSAQIQQQVIGKQNERNSYSLEYVVVQSESEKRNRFDLTLGTDYNRTTNYVAAGQERDGPLSLGYFGRFSYTFGGGLGKADEAGSGSLDTRLRLNQDGEVSTDLSLNIRF